MSSRRILVNFQGTLENLSTLKFSLASWGYYPKTARRAIADLLRCYVDSIDNQCNYPMSTAVCMAMMDLKGTFSFEVITKDTRVAVNHGVPLIAFRSDQDVMVLSSVDDLSDEGEIYHIRYGEVIEINDPKIRRVSLVNGTRVQEKIQPSEFYQFGMKELVAC